MINRAMTFVSLVLLCAGWCAGARAEIITVRAAEYDLENAVVFAPLPESLADEAALVLVDVERNAEIAAQVTDETPRQLVWQLQRPLRSGESRSYRLTAAARSKSDSETVSVVNDDGAIWVTVDGKPVLVYNAATVRAPDGVDEVYNRSGYIHPVFSPEGQLVTDDFAPDHPHQHGLMYAWTNTIFAERKIDFWNQKQRQGTVEHAEIVRLRSGPVFGEFVVRLRHLDLTTPDESRTALRETWRVRVYRQRNGGFLFDLVSSQEAVSSPLQIKAYHYGGIAIRGNRHWTLAGGGGFLTSEGLGRFRGNHSRPRWCGMFGKSGDGAGAGIAMFCHPDNFRAPQPVRLHPTMPYFCYAPLVLGDFRIEPNEPYCSRYRFLVHEGKLEQTAGDQIWREYALPPEVNVSQ